ncbi:MAG: hypothetical protein KDA41_23000 [Planctomycetales bacterium]|nr:hypothetical protein [Planctomycetales bacterium]
MDEPLRNCRICRALVDEEDLFCANCGAEVPHAEPQSIGRLAAAATTHNFTCSGCGASMSYDASAQSLRCPFCSSTEMQRQVDAKSVAPQSVLPFAVDRREAEAITRRWMSAGWLRPGDLAQTAIITKLANVYVPYWVFRARTHTYWTADTSRTPLGARGDWFPLTGEHRGLHQGVLVGASGALTPAETQALCPFPLEQADEPAGVDLDNVIVELFSVPRKYARPLAQQGLEAIERAECDQRYVPPRSRKVKVNTLLDGLSSRPMLLPVWIMAYRYKGSLFRVLINGSTGKLHGKRPISYTKIFAIAGAIAALLLLILLCTGALTALV